MIDVVLGIDPGLSGALAILPYRKEEGVTIQDMPVHQIKVNGSKKRQIDLYELARWLDNATKKLVIKHAFIENPHAMPQQGVSSSFNFGFACGTAQMLVAAHLIPMTLVRPATWKKAMGLTADKDASRRRASQLMPEYSHWWGRAKDDGRAEAILLAYWGLKQNV